LPRVNILAQETAIMHTIARSNNVLMLIIRSIIMNQ